MSWREVGGRETDGMMLEISGYRHRQRGAGGFNAKSPGNQKKGRELTRQPLKKYSSERLGP